MAVPFENTAGLIDNQTFVDWAASSWTITLGDAFWIIILTAVIGLAWMKTRNLGPTMAVAIIGSAIFSQILYSPMLQALFMWFVAIGIGILLFRIVISRLGR